MSSIVISGDSSGSITLAAPSVAGTNTATLPAATGTVMVSGNMPAFYAYSATVNAISANTNTKVALSQTLFDTNSNFNTSTYRFTPTVAGYYQFASLVSTTAANNSAGISFFKNGSVASYSNANYGNGSGFNNAVQLTQMLYLNGSTDYVELYYYCTGSSSTSGSSSQQVYMTGFLARAA